jgi:hypothetical protein
VLARKFKLMTHYPEVKAMMACEKWSPN